jgi:hypothetical protein
MAEVRSIYTFLFGGDNERMIETILVDISMAIYHKYIQKC